MSVFVIGAIQLACCELKNGQYGQKTDNFRAKMVRSINLTPDLGQTNINWSIKNQIKDSLPIMELHKTDLFCPLMAEFEVPDHFWSEKDAMTSSVKIFEIWFFRCIYSLAKGPGPCHIDGLLLRVAEENVKKLDSSCAVELNRFFLKSENSNYRFNSILPVVSVIWSDDASSCQFEDFELFIAHFNPKNLNLKSEFTSSSVNS